MADGEAGTTRAVWAWCLYDWANSAFTTLIVTFIYALYYTKTFAPNEAIGTAWWSRGVGATAILVALSSPILGAMADRHGRRRALMIATMVCVVASIALTFVSPRQAHAPLIAGGIFVIGNVAFELGMVFYNSFLPDLVPASKIGRVSGYGWGLGYLGGLLALVVGLVGFVGLEGMTPLLSLPTADGFHIRATNLLVAGWFLLFSIPAFVYLRDPIAPKDRISVAGAFRELAVTFRRIRQYKEIVKFLVARLVYNDALVTIFAFGAVYAGGTFGMEIGEVILFGIALNVTAGLGALFFGFMDDKLGGKPTIMVSLVALVAASFLAVLAPTKTWFWVAGLLVGIFAGPNQSASRSLMGRFVPERHKAEFFGFFAFSGKATAFMGPVLLGILSEAYGQRAGVSVVIPFFVIGALILLSVNEGAGMAAARAGQ